VVNGGNCAVGDVNWVHYVHAAHQPRVDGGLFRRVKAQTAHRLFLRDERRVLPQARLVIANSERTRADLIEHLQLPPPRVATIYYGIDPALFYPPSDEERTALRARLGWPADRPFVAFIGAMSDHRKGFDFLYAAWQALCRDPKWDAELVVIGTGADLPAWQARTAAEGLANRVQFLGFRRDVPDLLKACDALVAPTRYEAYGLGVHEAICCGLPAFVTRTAGVAERYPPEVKDLLLINLDSPGELVDRLRAWRQAPERLQAPLQQWSKTLRAYTWEHMAQRMVSTIESVP
jgi:glycosyltransferase involved in cell wall biosynthesis